MSSGYLIRLGKVKHENGILVALKHNKRILHQGQSTTANIDESRTSLNYSLTGDGSPEFIARYAKAQMILAGIDKPRKDAVRAVEIIFSLPIDRHKQDTHSYFSDCCDWVKQTFGGELLSFDVHLDESAPHAHAIILPLIDGRMIGSKMLGGQGNLKRLINKFHSDVAMHYGLSKTQKKPLSHQDKLKVERLVLMKLNKDPAMQSSVWACIRDSIHNDPIPYAQMLNIELEHKPQRLKSFVDIKRSKGRGTFVH